MQKLETGERRRGRRPNPDRTGQTRSAIVAAALDLFLERGFYGTRMTDVAARATLAKGTLYLHFTDKDALFEGVLRASLGEPIGRIGAIAPGPDETVRAFLSRTLLPLFRDLERSRRADLIRLVIREGGQFPALAQLHRRMVIEPAMAMIRALGARALERGEIASDAFTRLPQLMVGPALVATIWNGLYGKEDPLDTGAMFEAFLDVAFPLPAA